MKFFAAIASVLAFSLFNVAAADYSGDATYYYPDGNVSRTHAHQVLANLSDSGS